MIDTIKYGVVSRTAIDYSESNGELCRLIRKTDVDNGEENKRGSVREVIYAYQEYASMGAEQKHMLNQIYEDKINSAYIENLSTEEVSLSSEKMEAGWRTIYENDLPKQQQVWIGPGIKDWQIVQSIINRDAVGNIIETEDANGIRSQYYYGHNKSLKIAEFFNTSNEKVWADNFDDGSIDDSDPMIWSKSGMWTINHGILKSTNTAYLGNHNAEVQNFKFDIALRIVNDYSNIANWAGVHFGSTSNNIFNSGYLIYYRENGEINLYHEGSNLFSVFTGLVPNVWRHLSISVDGTKIEVFIDGQRFIDYSLSEPVPSGFVSLNSYQADTEYDDFRCYPVRAIAQSHAYDSLWSKENIFSDPNGRALSIKYDSFGRIQSIQDLYSENMFSNYLYYYSRSGNLSYNQLDPNYVLTQTWLKPGVYINSKNFYDGLNRMLQSQILVSEGKIITPKEYEALGRIVRVYKPYFMANTTLGFDPNYLNNDIGYYLNIGLFNVSNYPYAENEFYRDPLNRLKLAAFPGLTFKKGGKNILYTYGSDRINELFYVTKTDENGIKETIFTDKSGNHIKTIADSTALRLTTAFKYDILGRIVKSIPPRGDLLASAYVYNPKSQLVQKTTPDAGTVQYLYDKVGNLRLIKDAGHTGTVNNISISGVKEPTNSPEGSFILTLPGKVNLSLLRAYLISGSPVGNLIILSNGVEVCRVTVNSSTAASLSIVLPKGSYTYTSTVSGGSGVYPYTITCNTGCEFIYNKYDSFNRITENGEYESNSTGNFTQANANNPSFPTSGTIVTKKFFYDTPSTNSIASGQRNLRGQLSYSYTYQLGSICEEMYYSYDNFGNVEWIIQKTAGTPIGKKIQYKYDLQGNITQKNYYDLDNSSNNISFFYEYDLAGRLSKVYSDQNANGTSRVLEAIYTYNADGSVKRLQLGNAQGVDYTYNERGWLTMINHQNLGGVDNNGQPQDPGRDGFDSGLPADKFGEVIGYNNIDYHIGAPQYQNTTPQFNGNISWLMYAIQNVKFNGTQLCGWTYSYDGANRLTKADFGYYTNAWLQSNAYDLPAISYDPNGNILSLNRLSYSGIRLDNLSYTYQVNTNRLTSVFNQVNNRKQTYTYTYDSNGNMTSDSYRGLSIILYNTQNLPEQITKSNGNIVRYWYDANGNRLRKQEQASNGSILMDETYVLGIDGQTEAVYNTTTGALKFWNINAGGQMIGRIEP